MDVVANWLWQGTTVALVATAILRGSRRMSATTRYHLWWVTLAAVLVPPALSFRLPSFQLPASSSQLRATSSQRTVGRLCSEGLGWQLEAGDWKLVAGSWKHCASTPPEWTFSLFVFVWSAWVALSLSRTLAALVTLRRAKRASRPFPEAREMRLQTWLALRARGRRADLALSDGVRAAAVLGLTSPSIVVAPSALGALSDQELDQIVVHEWAHVQRRDDLARLVQRIIVALAGLHPAVWWIDRQLHLERETACDDWAVNATGIARGLAVCLTKLASLPGRPADAVLFPAAILSSELTTRVVRLLDRRRNTSTARRLRAPLLVTPVLAAMALIVASVELVVTSPVARNPLPAAPLAMSGTFCRRIVGSASFCDVGNRIVPRFERIRPTAERRTRLGHACRWWSPLHDSTDRAAPVRVVPDHPQIVEVQLGPDELPGTRSPVSADILPDLATDPAPAGSRPARSDTPWGAAADAGVTVGKGSQKAAVATAGFFTRLSKSITRVF